MEEVLGKRLVIVAGKGGVGKTTVAAALGMAAARAGKRTMVCEVAEQEQITQAFGKPAAGFNETEVAENLHTFSINPDDAKQEWLKHQLRSGALAGLLSSSRIFQYLTAAAPGLAEIVTIGKVWELAQLDRRTPRAAPYDLVILDAPATGHGLALHARAAHLRGRRQGRADPQPRQADRALHHRSRRARRSWPSRCPRRCR